MVIMRKLQFAGPVGYFVYQVKVIGACIDLKRSLLFKLKKRRKTKFENLIQSSI